MINEDVKKNMSDRVKLPVAIVEFRKSTYNDVFLPSVASIRRWSVKFLKSVIESSVSNVNVEEVLNLHERRVVVWLERDENVSNMMMANVVDVEQVWNRIFSLISTFVNVMDELCRVAVLDRKMRRVFTERIRKYVESEDDSIGDTYDDDIYAVIAFRTRLLELTKLITALYLNYRGYIPMFNVTYAKDRVYRSTIEYMNNLLAAEEAQARSRS